MIHATRSLAAHALRTISFAGSFALASALSAQLVFIPDTQMRTWLNDHVPGVVDGGGYMDTQHPSIGAFTSTTMHVDWDAADLTGVEYLTGLQIFNLSFNPQTVTAVTLNAFPPFVTHLDVHGYPGTALPAFPAGVEELIISMAVNLTTMPAFPSTMTFLNIHDAPSLTTLPPVPDETSSVTLNELSSITDLTGILPDTINDLVLMGFPQLPALPALPAFSNPDPWSTTILSLHDMPLITSLPALPDSLMMMELYGMTALTSLPVLPVALRDLYISNAPLLECLPTLPAPMEVLTASLTGVGCVPNIPAGLNTNLPLCGFYNAGICPFFSPSVSGTVYHDVNANGVRDAGEPGVGYADVDIAPGSTLTGVADNGFYAQAMDAGTYTINANVSNAYVTSITPASHSAVLVNVSDVDSLNDFGVLLQANVQDLVVDLTEVTPGRPGFNNAVQLTYGNQGTIDMSGTVSFTFDGDQVWNSSTPPPDMLAGNTATWNFTSLVISEQRQIDISLYTDPAVLIGTPITHTAVADPAVTDQTPGDNVDVITSEVVASYDPNDKAVSPLEMSSPQVASGERLTYTIRFQNTGTYPAERVIISDTLSTDLQWNTMDLVASSHPCTWFIHDGTLRFSFDPINLPDSTSNEPASHGFVTFSMAPQATLTDGMQVGNTANIYFDFNAPVITNEALFGVNDPQGIASAEGAGPVLSPNPVHDVLRVGSLSGSRSVLTVLDATGRRVTTTLVTGPSVLLDVSALPSGAYQLRLDEEGVVRHFVKY